MTHYSLGGTQLHRQNKHVEHFSVQCSPIAISPQGWNLAETDTAEAVGRRLECNKDISSIFIACRDKSHSHSLCCVVVSSIIGQCLSKNRKTTESHKRLHSSSSAVSLICLSWLSALNRLLLVLQLHFSHFLSLLLQPSLQRSVFLCSWAFCFPGHLGNWKQKEVG